MTKLEFWYDFASSYSYRSAMRIEGLCLPAGIEIVWRPFLLGPIFAANGWDTSPFRIYPIKGRNMVRDLERRCAALGLPFVLPEPAPQNSLLAARLALIADEEGWCAEFTKAVFLHQFGHGGQIASPGDLAPLIEDAGHDPVALFTRATEDGIKLQLRANTEAAQTLGLYGAPSFVTDDNELFWGDDRLEDAVKWARTGRL